MRSKVAKLLHRVALKSPATDEQRPQVLRGLKRGWNSTPSNQRFALRKRLEATLKEK